MTPPFELFELPPEHDLYLDFGAAVLDAAGRAVAYCAKVDEATEIVRSLNTVHKP